MYRKEKLNYDCWLNGIMLIVNVNLTNGNIIILEENVVLCKWSRKVIEILIFHSVKSVDNTFKIKGLFQTKNSLQNKSE